MPSPKSAGCLLVTLLAAGLPSVQAAPEITVIHREKVVLRIRTPTATQIDPPKQGFVTLDVDPDTGGEATLRLAWPDTEESVLRLWAREKPGPGGSGRVELSAELQLPDGSKVRSQRRLMADRDSTALFEVFRRGQRALILTIESERIEETVLPGIRDAPGRDVLFLLDVQRVIAGQVIPVEQNQLHSFLGEAVTYSFRLGGTADAESVRVELKAVRVMGDFLEVDVAVSGSLPGPDGRHLVSRGEELLVSRGAASTFALESGDPPTGYRFIVTPVF